MPRGVYDRGSRSKGHAGRGQSTGAGSAAAVALAVSERAGEEAVGQISQIASVIKSLHHRISNTVLEIGEKFFEIKKVLDAMDVEVRRELKLPAFSTWMNTVAPEACGMSPRAAWGYYGAYAEAEAAGLKEQTITALAPNVLKTEKARKLVFIALRRSPELAHQLNDAAKNPTRLREIARSPEAQRILARLTPGEVKGVGAKVKHYVLSALKPTLGVPKEEFDLPKANAALTELATGLNAAMESLHIAEKVKIDVKALTAGDVEVMYAARAMTAAAEVSTTEAVGATTLMRPEDLMSGLMKLIQAGSAKIVHGGATA